MKRRYLLLLAVAACGESPAPVEPAEVRDVVGEPGSGSFTLQSDLMAGADVEQLGVDSAGGIVVAADGRVSVLEAGVLVDRNYYRGEGDPETLGAVRSIARRATGGAFIGTEHGLFLLDELFVVHSPLVEASEVRGVFEQPLGPMAGLWLATDQGPLRREGENLQRISVEGLAHRATAIAIAKNGERGLAVIDGVLVIIESSPSGLVSQTPSFDPGPINAVAAGDGGLYAATDRGLYAFGVASDTAWLRYALAKGMTDAPAVKTVTVDVTGVVWASAGEKLYRIEGEVVTAFEAPGAPSSLRIDSLGDLWLAAGAQIAQRGTSALGDRVTFTADVLPWVTAQCSTCHRNQTQDFESYEVFKALAANAFGRVRSGDMPRCTGNLRCATELRLGPDDYAVLEQWLRYGLPE